MAPGGRPLILVVDDEVSLVDLLRYNLENAGFDVVEALDGDEALLMAEEQRPDLIILDWMLPQVSGIEVCRRLRRRPDLGDMPIIMVTARVEEQHQVRALDTGADDYMTKPFSPIELIARVKAVLRRSRPEASAELLEFGDVTMDLVSHRVKRDGRSVQLGPTEFRLLRYFLERPRRVLSREQLLDSVWGRDIYVEPRTVDVHIRRLRQALNANGESDIIRTVRSAGYSLDNQA